MKPNGYFLIKILKRVNLYLWSMDKSELESSMKKGMQIVEAFKDDNGFAYIKVNDELLRIS